MNNGLLEISIINAFIFCCHLQELLALEDHIGYVSTGLSEEAAVASLKRSNYFLLADENAQKEFCSICQVPCL